MAKGKLQKFAEMETFSNVFQYPFSTIQETPFSMKGQWNKDYFNNDNPIILELGCGKGEYTVELAKLFPQMNFIGVDIKGARMWSGAKQALEEKLPNVAFLRTNIEFIDHFFHINEVNEIWLTFSDPQMKNVKKRLTGTTFLKRYQRFLVDNGLVHLKTDSNFLFTYTKEMVKHNQLFVHESTTDLYGTNELKEETKQLLSIQTYYEKMWLERGLNIKYMCFELKKDTELTEPDVEISLDEYRSYHRNKRSELETSK